VDEHHDAALGAAKVLGLAMEMQRAVLDVSCFFEVANGIDVVIWMQAWGRTMHSATNAHTFAMLLLL
jgi:hypothetical protein